MKDKNGQELSGEETWEKVEGRLRAWGLEMKTGLLWWLVGNMPFHTWRRFFYRWAGMKIGRGSAIHMQARIFDPDHIVIGEDTIIGEKVTLDGRRQLKNSRGGIKIGDHVDIASEVMIWTSEHDLKSQTWDPIEEPVEIGDYAFIGPRVIILPGVKVGRGAVIAAGAVVTKDVVEKTIVAGVPAKVIGTRQGELKYKLGRARIWQ